MSDVKLYGFPISTYVRTVRIALAEKGVDFELIPHTPNTPEILALNPTGKVPAFSHDDFLLFETMAIIDYIDEAFDGPALKPSDVKQRAIMNQWISYINAYVFQVMIHEIVLLRFEIRPMDQATIDAAIPKTKEQLALIEAGLADHTYLAGNNASLADFMLYPIIAFLAMAPEASLIAEYPAVTAWQKRMESKKSVIDSAPSF